MQFDDGHEDPCEEVPLVSDPPPHTHTHSQTQDSSRPTSVRGEMMANLDVLEIANVRLSVSYVAGVVLFGTNEKVGTEMAEMSAALSHEWSVNPRSAGVFSRTCPAGGGGAYSAPPA